jgi:hypothetical protein
LLGVQGAEIQIRFLVLRGPGKYSLIHSCSFFFSVHGREQAGQEELGLGIFRFLRDDSLAMFQGFSEIALADVEGSQTQL